jgi:hypothetical protein
MTKSKWIPNVALFLVLALSVYGVYVFVEKPELALQESGKAKLSFLKEFDKINLITTSNYTWQKEGSTWFDVMGKVPINEKLITELVSKFDQLKIKKELSLKDLENENKLAFIPAEAPFIEFKTVDAKTYRYTLGTHLGFSENFYMQESVGERDHVYVLEDFSEATAFYDTKTGPKKDYHYRKWVSLLSLQAKFFWNRSPFNKLNNVQKLWLSTEKRGSFVLDSKYKQTRPAIPKGIGFNDEYLKHFIGQLNDIQAIEIYKKKSSRLANQLVKGEIYLEDETRIRFFLLGHRNGKDGYFLYVVGKEFIFELTNESSKPMFSTVQDFWSKKAISDTTELSKKEAAIEITFEDNKKSYELNLPVEKDFKVFLKNESKLVPKTENFKKLFRLLLGERPFGEADKVTKVKLSELNKKRGLRVKILDKEFGIQHENDELIISNYQDKVKLHYLVGKKSPIGLNTKEYISSGSAL